MADWRMVGRSSEALMRPEISFSAKSCSLLFFSSASVRFNAVDVGMGDDKARNFPAGEHGVRRRPGRYDLRSAKRGRIPARRF